MTALWLTIAGGVAVAVIVLVVGTVLRHFRDRSGHSLIVSVDPNGFMEDCIYVGQERPVFDHEPEVVNDETQVALGWQSVRLSARGRDNRGVVVQRLRAEVVDRREPAAGWYIFPERGGGLDVRLFAVDLDADPPVAVLAQEDMRKPELEQPTLNYAFTVSDSDVESWELEVFTTDGWVRWALLIDYEIGSRHRTFKLEHPHFAVTAAGPGQNAYAHTPGEGWQHMDHSGESASHNARNWREKFGAAEL